MITSYRIHQNLALKSNLMRGRISKTQMTEKKFIESSSHSEAQHLKLVSLERYKQASHSNKQHQIKDKLKLKTLIIHIYAERTTTRLRLRSSHTSKRSNQGRWSDLNQRTRSRVQRSSLLLFVHAALAMTLFAAESTWWVLRLLRRKRRRAGDRR